MAKLICSHCGNSDFDEKIYQEIFVPYIWNEDTQQYHQQKDELGEAESYGLYCSKCKNDVPFVWLDLGIGK